MFNFQVSEEGIFGNWFSVFSNGSVVVAQKLDRSRAAVLTLPVVVTDASATSLQQAYGKFFVLLCELLGLQTVQISVLEFWNCLTLLTFDVVDQNWDENKKKKLHGWIRCRYHLLML